MTALQLFKEVGLSEMLNSVKDEWDNGSYLKPMAAGAGIGGLGFGASALMQKGEEGENKSDKTKRILTQMLKGTALGGAAGGAVGGANKLYKDFISNDGKDKDTPKNDPQADQKLTKAEEPSKPLPRDIHEWADQDRGKVTASASALGGAVGGTAGYTAGAKAEKAIPDRVKALEASPKMRDYNAVKEMVTPGSGKGYGVLQEVMNNSQGSVSLNDIQGKLGGGYSSRAAAAIAQQLGQHSNAMAAGSTRFVNPASQAEMLDLAKSISSAPADPNLDKLVSNPSHRSTITKLKDMIDPATNRIPSSIGFDQLDVIRQGDDWLKSARKPLAHKGGLVGLGLGASLGGAGAYFGLGNGDKPGLPGGEAQPMTPRQINTGMLGR